MEEVKSVSFRVEESKDEAQSSFLEHKRRQASEGIVTSISPSVGGSARQPTSFKEEAIHEMNDEDDDNEKDDATAATDNDEDTTFWGGNMVDSINQHKGNMLLYAGDCMSMHGMYYAMYHNNGWLRTLAYLCIWLGFGAFFLYLTIPLIRSYNNGAVNTNAVFVESSVGGIPLPVVTVCPRGSGRRCDCLLWRRLYCHYTVNNFNPEFRSSFAEFACIDEVDNFIADNLVWINPRCEDFNSSSSTLFLMDDSCEPTQEEIVDNPTLEAFTGNALFEIALAREQEFGEPFLTFDELSNYGLKFVGDNTTFFRESTTGSPFLFPDEEVVRYFWEVLRFQDCVQLRPNPANNTQSLSGSRNGLSIIVTGLRPNDFVVTDIDRAAAAVDVNIRIQSPGDDAVFVVQREDYFPVRAGFITDVQYEIQSIQRRPGYGDLPSRTCQVGAQRQRGACVDFLALQSAAQDCDCAGPSEIIGDQGGRRGVVVPEYSACPATDSEGFQCFLSGIENVSNSATVPFEVCPNPCTTTTANFVRKSELPLLDTQVRYIRALDELLNEVNSTIRSEETIILHIGLDTLVTSESQEVPATSFGSLMGSIGGNAGLWCGLSFVMIFEVIEFLVVATLFKSGWSRIRKQRSRRQLLAHIGHPMSRRQLGHMD